MRMANESAISLLPLMVKNPGVPVCIPGHMALARNLSSNLKISLYVFGPIAPNWLVGSKCFHAQLRNVQSSSLMKMPR